MYDQNPMLHKLNIDDLARDHRTKQDLPRNASGLHRFTTIAITLVVVIAAVFVQSANVV